MDKVDVMGVKAPDHTAKEGCGGKSQNPVSGTIYA